MTTFLIVAGALALLTAAVLVWPLLARGGRAESRDAADARVFRDQLDEVERDLQRGVISPVEAEGARAEISRRLLRATGRAELEAAPTKAPGTVTGLVAGLALLAAPLVAAVVYLSTGAPGEPDRPLFARDAATQQAEGQRIAQAEAEARMAEVDRGEPPSFPQDYLDLIERLEGIVAQRPDDPEGHRLLANAYVQMERYAEAWPLFERLIEIRGEEAPAALYATQAESMVLAAGGYVSSEAREVIAAALARDPEQPIARYYRGLALAQAGQLDAGIAIWQDLVAKAGPDAPWLPFVENMLAEATRMKREGGRPPGPDAAEMAAAAEMSPEERASMIEGMISRLEERLTTEGGSAEEWFRLINAKLRLGRPEEAAQSYAAAMEALPDGADKDALKRAVSEMGGLAPRAGAPAPSVDDIAVAEEMSPEERQAMIEGMVSRLQTRLEADGGEPEEFLRLINAYRVLGRTEEARAAYDLSQEKLEGSAASFVREQALVLGVIEE